MDTLCQRSLGSIFIVNTIKKDQDFSDTLYKQNFNKICATCRAESNCICNKNVDDYKN